jgi:transposase
LYPASGFLYASELEDNIKKKTLTYYEKSEEKRAEFIARLKRVAQGKRVYIDESGVDTCLQREFARAPRGDIVEELTRGNKYERVNIIGAVCQENYFAIKCYNQTTDSAFFESWFKDCLLKAIPSGVGYTIIMDNALFHRKKVLRKLARGKVRLLFLPPYSPDYNKIEKSWANMKRYLRSYLHCFTSVYAAIFHYFDIPNV